MGRQLRRRTVLAGGVLVGAGLLPLTACESEPAPRPAPDPDDLVRAAAVDRERALLQAYDAAAAAQPSLAARLTPVRAEHAEHLGALEGAPAPASSAAPAPSTPPVPPPAADPAAVLAALLAAERATSSAHAAAALDAGSRELAAVLASLSASEASHPVALA